MLFFLSAIAGRLWSRFQPVAPFVTEIAHRLQDAPNEFAMLVNAPDDELRLHAVSGVLARQGVLLIETSKDVQLRTSFFDDVPLNFLEKRTLTKAIDLWIDLADESQFVGFFELGGLRVTGVWVDEAAEIDPVAWQNLGEAA